MTLLYLDGFAHQNLTRYSGGSAAFGTNGVAQGAMQNYYVFNMGVSAGLPKIVTASAEIITGFRFFPGAIATGANIVQLWGDAFSTVHLALRTNASQQIEMVRGGTIIGTGTTVMSTTSWYYIEFRATLSDTVGIAQVRLNGSTVNEIDFTGDTRNGGTSTNIDTVKILGNSNWYFSDWYILNALGSAPNNTFLGDTVVRTLVPTGDGDLSQLTGSDGNSVANWQQVDELPGSGTDYNGSPTAGNEDTYALTDLPATANRVFGAQLSTLMAKSDAGAGNAKSVLRLSGTDYTPGGARGLSTSYTEYLDMFGTSPATGTQWTASEINAAQIGMQVV